MSHTHLFGGGIQRSVAKFVPTVDWAFSLGTTRVHGGDARARVLDLCRGGNY